MLSSMVDIDDNQYRLVKGKQDEPWKDGGLHCTLDLYGKSYFSYGWLYIMASGRVWSNHYLLTFTHPTSPPILITQLCRSAEC